MECHGGHNTTVPTGTGTAALIFFDCTYGALSTQSVIPRRLANAFMAVSSFGNIIVNTFTSARGVFDHFRLTTFHWLTGS